MHGTTACPVNAGSVARTSGNVVRGAVEVTVLLDDGAQQTTLGGSVFVVPAGRWHRQAPQPVVSLMFVTPTEGTDASWSDDPRRYEERAA